MGTVWPMSPVADPKLLCHRTLPSRDSSIASLSCWSTSSVTTVARARLVSVTPGEGWLESCFR